MAGKGTAPAQLQAPFSFKKPESGYLRIGDKISFSVEESEVFPLKGRRLRGEEMGIAEAVERRKRMTEERKKREREDGIREMLNEDEKEATGENNEDLKLESFDASSIDPVKEFGFLVIGHEFDGYKSKLKDIRKWNWYVDDAGNSSEDGEDFEGEVSKRRTAGMKKNKKRGDDNDDEDWIGESNDRKELISMLRMVSDGEREVWAPRILLKARHQVEKRSISNFKRDLNMKMKAMNPLKASSLTMTNWRRKKRKRRRKIMTRTKKRNTDATAKR